ncbi:MAG: hypothetical protein ABL994_22955 [Verrucomicrobiales bacterium]
MSEDLEIDLTTFGRQFREFMVYSTRSIEEEFRLQCKGLMTEVIDITPPATGKGTRGKARNLGRSAIRRDLVGYGGFARHQKRAGIFTVLSDSLIDSAIETGAYEGGENVKLWVRKDGTVYGTQQHYFRPDASMSEMRDHHKRFFKNGKMSQAGAFTREIGRWKWIDQMVVRESTFDRYLKSVERKVGLYAAGWRPGAEGIGVTVPPYMKGHSAIGGFHLTFTGADLSMGVINAVGFGSIDRDMRRRIQWAADNQARKMERQLPYIIRKHEQLVN